MKQATPSEHLQVCAGPQNYSLRTVQPKGDIGQSSLGYRSPLYPRGERLYLSGSNHRLVFVESLAMEATFVLGCWRKSWVTMERLTLMDGRSQVLSSPRIILLSLSNLLIAERLLCSKCTFHVRKCFQKNTGIKRSSTSPCSSRSIK